jgi:hypothetical protein
VLMNDAMTRHRMDTVSWPLRWQCDQQLYDHTCSSHRLPLLFARSPILVLTSWEFLSLS